MKKLLVFFCLLVNGRLCTMEIQSKQDRCSDLFSKLQQPVEKGFKGSADDYRKILLQEIESNLNTEDFSYDLPVDSQAKCHGETFLYRVAQYEFPTLTQKLASSATKLNLSKVFWQASMQGSTAIVDILLKANPLITWQDSTHLGTALHNAAFQGHKEVVEKIIKYCLAHDKNALSALDSYGQTPLDYAKEKGDEQIIALIENALHE